MGASVTGLLTACAASNKRRAAVSSENWREWGLPCKTVLRMKEHSTCVYVWYRASAQCWCYYSNKYIKHIISSVQVNSVTQPWLTTTPWTAGHQASLPISNSRRLFKLISIESVMPSNHLIFCCLLLLQPPILPSIRVFYNESVLPIGWPKY